MPVTRIISGFAGSLPIAVPQSGTRPTSDRVREAIYSALESRDAIHGAHVADLYAGSGALGLEAASRGAASVVLVEKSKAAATVCRRNADAVRAAAKVGGPDISVAVASVAGFLAASAAVFDLVFIDPPYDLAETILAATLDALPPHLAPDAIVLVERSARSPEPTWPPSLTLDRRKDYGETTLWWVHNDEP